MEITVATIITTLTLVAGEITKLTNIPNKYIPLQNLIIAAIASIICIIFKVQDMGIMQTIITCIFATMSAGGLADLQKINKQETKIEESTVTELSDGLGDDEDEIESNEQDSSSTQE